MIDLDALLDPMSVAGETVRFDLAAFRSRVTRELLQVRVRMTAQAFGTGVQPVPANVTRDGTALDVDAAGLSAANAAVRSRLEAGPEGALTCLRALSEAGGRLDRVARAFGARLCRQARPSPTSFLAYVEAAARYQALGALKFAVPETVRHRLGEVLDVDALLAPEVPSLWSALRSRELALARVRHRGPAVHYRQRLVRHQRAHGYLFGEDVDFRDHESLDAIDARVAGLGPAVAAHRRALTQTLARERANKLGARQAFVAWLQSNGGGDDAATLVSHVLLARALAAHEDQNRRAKMRFLRDLRDLADLSGLDLERAGLQEFHAVCAGKAA